MWFTVYTSRDLKGSVFIQYNRRQSIYNRADMLMTDRKIHSVY